jgi:hypothetical protein
MLPKKVGALSNKRIIVNVRRAFEALLDPRIARYLGELLALSAPTAMGTIPGKRECFVCCRPWARAAWRVEQLGQIGKNKPAKRQSGWDAWGNEVQKFDSVPLQSDERRNYHARS